MQIKASSGHIIQSEIQALVLAVSPNQFAAQKKTAKVKPRSKPRLLNRHVDELNKASQGELLKQIRHEEFKGGSGKTWSTILKLADKVMPIMLVGSPTEGQTTIEQTNFYRRLGSALADFTRRHKISRLGLTQDCLELNSTINLEALLEGLWLSGYRFTRYKSKPDPNSEPLESLVLFGSHKPKTDNIEFAKILTEATCLARDLINIPPVDCTPSLLVKTCRDIARKEKLQIEVFDKAKLKKLGAGALLAVAKGSREDPFLIKMTYRPKKKSKNVISLVGKGVTFDSGGLSIKSATGMETMKCDMSGAAAVIATMQIVAYLKPKVEIRAYIPTTENMINGQATRPGDIVKALSGKTIEILNTDAEGRLILADAITLAERDKCNVIIDLATLTGACVVALGTDYAGIFSNDDKLASELIDAADLSGERLWRMPLAKEYKDWIKSPVADIKNIGKGTGGAITGALFLEEFVDKAKWAHLDIAGPAFADGDSGYIRRGGVGFGVRTLARYIANL